MKLKTIVFHLHFAFADEIFRLQARQFAVQAKTTTIYLDCPWSSPPR